MNQQTPPSTTNPSLHVPTAQLPHTLLHSFNSEKIHGFPQNSPCVSPINGSILVKDNQKKKNRNLSEDSQKTFFSFASTSVSSNSEKLFNKEKETKRNFTSKNSTTHHLRKDSNLSNNQIHQKDTGKKPYLPKNLKDLHIPIFQLTDRMQNLMESHNEHSMALKVVGGFEVFSAFKRAWGNMIFPIQLHHIETNATFQVIQLSLKHKSDKEFILANQPWITGPHVILCEDWNFFVQHPLNCFKFAQFWLQVLNLPRLFMDEEAIRDIIERSGKGTVLQINLESSPPRDLVIMDLKNPSC